MTPTQTDYFSKNFQWTMLEKALEKTVEGKSVFQLFEDSEGMLYEMFETEESDLIIEQMKEIGLDKLLEKAISIYGDNPDIYPTLLTENTTHPFVDEEEKERHKRLVKMNQLEIFVLLFIHGNNIAVKELLSKNEKGEFISIVNRVKPMDKKTTDTLREEVQRKVKETL